MSRLEYRHLQLRVQLGQLVGREDAAGAGADDSDRLARLLLGGGIELLPVGQDEGEAGNPLDALVGAGDQEVDPPVGQGDVDAAEGGHGVHEEGLAGGLGHLAHRGHVVEDAAGGLPVDHGHVGDGGVLRQILGHHAGLGALVVGLLIEGVGHPGVAADVGHPQAIGPVGGDEDLVLGPHHGGEDGLHPEGAAALHQHGGVRRLGHMAQGQQLGADALGDLLVIVVPGAVVVRGPGVKSLYWFMILLPFLISSIFPGCFPVFVHKKRARSRPSLMEYDGDHGIAQGLAASEISMWCS